MMLLCAFTSCRENIEDFAKDPYKIVKKSGFDMPSFSTQYSVVDISDETNEWSNCLYKLTFDSVLTKENISDLDFLVKKDRHWKFSSTDSTYYYMFQSPDEKDIRISINPKTRKALVKYSWNTLFN